MQIILTWISSQEVKQIRCFFTKQCYRCGTDTCVHSWILHYKQTRSPIQNLNADVTPSIVTCHWEWDPGFSMWYGSIGMGSAAIKWVWQIFIATPELIKKYSRSQSVEQFRVPSTFYHLRRVHIHCTLQDLTLNLTKDHVKYLYHIKYI